MFSRWILHIFTIQKESEISWEVVWMMYEIKDEDLLANCIEICSLQSAYHDCLGDV